MTYCARGPLALIEPGFDVLAITPRGPSQAALEPLLERLESELGARLLTIAGDASARKRDCSIAMPTGVEPWLSPVVSILGGQTIQSAHALSARSPSPADHGRAAPGTKRPTSCDVGPAVVMSGGGRRCCQLMAPLTGVCRPACHC